MCPVSPLPHIRGSIRGISADLQAVLAGTASSVQLKAVVHVCHGNAIGALVRRGHLDRLVRLHGLSLGDLAFDCISDLFARDEHGRYLALRSYFSAYDTQAFSDEEAYFHLQRLTFLKVRNGLFRLYSEMDPQLAKILHNVKVAARALDLFTEVDRLGEACLAPSLCDTSDHLPAVSPDELAASLSEVASGNEFVPELLGKLSLLLRRQNSFSRIIPTVTIGLAIRSFYEKKKILQLPDHTTGIDEASIDARQAVHEACKAVRAKTYHKYVNRKKVDPEIFDLYFDVITLMLRMRFVENDGGDFQLSENFRKLTPGMSLQEYRVKHRNKLEYLARLAHRHAAKLLQG